MKIDTYHKAQDALSLLAKEASNAGNDEITDSLDALASELQQLWSQTVDLEEKSDGGG